MESIMKVFLKDREEDYEDKPIELSSVQEFGIVSDFLFIVRCKNGKHIFDVGLIDRVLVSGNQEFVEDLDDTYKWPFDFVICSTLPIEESK